MPPNVTPFNCDGHINYVATLHLVTLKHDICRIARSNLANSKVNEAPRCHLHASDCTRTISSFGSAALDSEISRVQKVLVIGAICRCPERCVSDASGLRAIACL